MVPVTRLWVACFLFLCLLAGKVSSSCNTASAGECRYAHNVPGASLAGFGYDVVTLQSKAASVIDVNAWRNPNGSCILCRNQLLSGARQRLPLSLVDWTVQRRCRHAMSSELFRSAAELLESATSMISNGWKMDLKVSPKPGITVNWMVGGSRSHLTSFSTSRAKSDRYSFTSQEFECRNYRYRVKTKPHLSPEFARALAALPKTRNGYNNARYKNLVQTYGTHFIQDVTLGGRIREVTAIQTCKAVSSGTTAEKVKDCLNTEAGVQVGFVGVSVGYERCKELATSMAHRASMSQVFTDRVIEVSGGSTTRIDVFSPRAGTTFTHWLDTLKTQPGVVHYGLKPLHHLLPTNDARYPILRDYISKYIEANALAQICAVRRCPPGSFRQDGKRCSCYCAGDTRVDRQCCPKEKGIGRLTVMVKQGRDLWGDIIGGTDGYVIVKYGRAKAQTSVISNNNNPNWNTNLDLGEVKGGNGGRLTIEVWDSDSISSDDLLGKCEVTLLSGTHQKMCYLKHGKVTCSYTFTCGPHLEGSTCQEYTARPDGPAFSPDLGSGNFTLPLVFPTPPPAQEAPPLVVLA